LILGNVKQVTEQVLEYHRMFGDRLHSSCDSNIRPTSGERGAAMRLWASGEFGADELSQRPAHDSAVIETIDTHTLGSDSDRPRGFPSCAPHAERSIRDLLRRHGDLRQALMWSPRHLVMFGAVVVHPPTGADWSGVHGRRRSGGDVRPRTIVR